MERLSQFKQRFSEMPRLLRTLVVASVGIGLVFSIIPLLPGASFELGERELTYQELWHTRVAFAIFAVGVLMLGVAVFLRKSWSRPVIVVLPLLQLLPFLAVHWAFDAPNPVASPAAFAGSFAVWVVAAVAYLFGTPSAREHFAKPL